MDNFTFFILGLIVLVVAVVVAIICINKKKSFIFPIALLVLGFILAFIGLFNSEHEDSQTNQLSVMNSSVSEPLKNFK